MKTNPRIRLGLCLIIWLLSLNNIYAISDSLLIRAHFNNRPLEEVLDHLSATYQLTFSYEPSAVEGVRITAHIEERPLDEAAAVIFGASGLEFLILRNNEIMIRPKSKSEAILEEIVKPIRPKILEIKGYIRDQENQLPLPYANISLPGTRYGTISQQDGYFTFKIPYTEKAFSILISYIGYDAKQVDIPVGKKDVVVDLQAQHRSLPEVEIEEKPSLFKQNNRISQLALSAKQLKSLPSLGQQDLMHALKYMPGVNGLDESSAGFSVRGGTEDENLIILDDITLYNIDHFWGVFSTFNPEAIEEVNLYKSDFPIRYGGKTSSVIELVGKAADPDRVQGGLGINMLSSNLSLEVPIGNKLGVSFHGRRSYTNIIQSDLYQNLFDFATNEMEVGGNESIENQPINTVEALTPKYHFGDFHTKVQFRPKEGESLSLTYFQGRDVLDLSDNRTFSFKRNRTTVQIEENTLNLRQWQNRGGSFQWEKVWSPKLTSYFSSSFSSYETDFELDVQATRTIRTRSDSKQIAFLKDVNDVSDLTFRGHFDWEINRKNTLVFGGEFTDTKVDYNLQVNDRKPIERNDEAGTIAIFAEYNFSPNEKFLFNIGLRDNYYRPLAKHYLSPRISATFSPNSHLKFKAAIGQYYQFTQEIDVNQKGNVRDVWILANGLSVPINKSTHYVGGFSINYPDFFIDVEAYRKDITGLATFVSLNPSVDSVGNPRPNTGVYRFFQGTGEALGLDILLQKTSGLYTGWLAYSLGRVMHQFDNINRNEPFPAEEDQRHQIKLVNMLRVGKWDLSLSWVYGSGRVYSDVEGQIRDRANGRSILFNTERLPAYQRVDIGATYNFKLGKLSGEAGGSIYNLFDNQNVKYRQYLYSVQEQVNANGATNLRVIGSDAELLGFTPNIFFNIRF